MDVPRELSVTPVMSPRLRFGGAVVAEAVNVLALDVTFEDFFGAQDVQSAGASSVLKKVAQGLRMEALAEELGLGEEEQKLALALAAALGSDVDAVASAVVGARVTREDVQQHAVEIGCPKLLTPQVKSGIMKFAQFVKTIEALGVVRFEGTLEGRSLLGHAAIVVVDGARWHAVLREAVGFVYFKSVGSIIDHVYLFGLGSARGFASAGTEKVVPRARPGFGVELNGTQKKEQALFRARRLEFTAKKMASNLKRYTNSRIGKNNVCAPKRSDALHELLAACEREARM